MKPDFGYINYIINPVSGLVSNKAVARDFAEYLTQNGYHVKQNFTKSLAHASELAAGASQNGDCSLVVVFGGDGTIRQVAAALKNSHTPLLIIPCGTENLLAKQFNIKRKLQDIIDIFDNWNIQAMDLGRINQQVFTSVVGFGFDADIVRSVNKHRTGHISYLNYFAPILRTLFKYSFPTVNVEADGRQFFNGPGLVFVGNIPRYATGLNILKNANPYDGQLDLCIFKCSSRSRLLKQFALTAISKHLGSDDIIYRQVTSVRVTSDSPELRVEVDGDPGPAVPAEIDILPAALKLLLPEATKMI